MKLTRGAEYGLRGIIYLARNQGHCRSLAEIAQTEQVSRKFLARLLKILEKKGIVRVKLGKKGGFELKKSPRRISMLEIVEAIEGKIALNRCLLNDRECYRRCSCTMYQIWARAQKKFVKELKKTTLDKLI